MLPSFRNGVIGCVCFGYALIGGAIPWNVLDWGLGWSSEGTQRTASTSQTWAQEKPRTGAQLNVPWPTTGGKQFWTDHRYAFGWRLQHNSLTDHWRVLDARDFRRAWGSRDTCLAVLERHGRNSAESQTAPESVVVLVHGLMRSSDSMAPLDAAFTARGDTLPIAFGYASTQASIDDHAASLREWVETLPGQPKISFVAHSLGNIVIRRAISSWQNDGDPAQVLPRLHRFVMLGPPNQGSSIAKQLSTIGLFERLTGNSGQELGAVWGNIQDRLATPPCPFCIIAGDLSQSSFKNPLIAPHSDFVVTVDETRLDGAAEYVTLPVLHSFLMSDRSAVAATLRFIEPMDADSLDSQVSSNETNGETISNAPASLRSPDVASPTPTSPLP